MPTATKRRRPRQKPTLDDLYGGGIQGNMLRGQYHTEHVYAWFQKRHRQAIRFIDHDGFIRRGEHHWKVPYGVRIALTQRLTHAQMVNKYPFFGYYDESLYLLGVSLIEQEQPEGPRNISPASCATIRTASSPMMERSIWKD